MKKIAVIKIDPARRHIAKLTIDRRPETLARIVGRGARYEEICRHEENPVIIVCADKEKVTEGPKFRIRGGKMAIGTALLAGFHANRAVNVPVDLAWANRMVEWID